MSWYDRLGESAIGRILQGIIILSLAGVIGAILNAIPFPTTFNFGNETIDISFIGYLLKVFAPILLALEGLRRIGVKI